MTIIFRTYFIFLMSETPQDLYNAHMSETGAKSVALSDLWSPSPEHEMYLWTSFKNICIIDRKFHKLKSRFRQRTIFRSL